MNRFFIFCTIFFLFSCAENREENSRAFIQGKIISQTVKFQYYEIKLISADQPVAVATPDGLGNFVISGPISYADYTLKSPEKIKFFSADKNGCKLSLDSLSIIIPKSITYLTFKNITLRK